MKSIPVRVHSVKPAPARRLFTVHGWDNGSDYDAEKPANHVRKLRATDSGDAETVADAAWIREGIRCDVVEAF